MSNPIIDSQRQRVRELEHALLLEKAKLEGMEAMLQGGIVVRPDSGRLGLKGSRAPVTVSHTGGGKAPGQLSMGWRSVLEYFFAHDLKFTETEASAFYRQQTGKDMRPRDVRRRLEGYANEHQFLEIEPDSRFRVTNVAAERFGFERSPKGGMALDLDRGQLATPLPLGDREGGEARWNPNNF